MLHWALISSFDLKKYTEREGLPGSLMITLLAPTSTNWAIRIGFANVFGIKSSKNDGSFFFISCRQPNLFDAISGLDMNALSQGGEGLSTRASLFPSDIYTILNLSARHFSHTNIR